MKSFKRLRSVRKSGDEQGYIYYCCATYESQPPWVKRKIDELCVSAGGDYAPALKEYMTTTADWVYICNKHSISSATLERIRRKFYNGW